MLISVFHKLTIVNSLNCTIPDFKIWYGVKNYGFISRFLLFVVLFSQKDFKNKTLTVRERFQMQPPCPGKLSDAATRGVL